MNKREMIHALIDKLLDVEESGTKKELHFSYFTTLGLDFFFYEGNGSRDYVRPRCCFYPRNEEDLSRQFERALVEIELTRNTPDVEPKVSLTLTEEKARELGLIA